MIADVAKRKAPSKLKVTVGAWIHTPIDILEGTEEEREGVLGSTHPLIYWKVKKRREKECLDPHTN